jgi:hypothetical protein
VDNSEMLLLGGFCFANRFQDIHPTSFPLSVEIFYELLENTKTSTSAPHSASKFKIVGLKVQLLLTKNLLCA